MARAVVDSSTPIHLARIGRVPLLDEPFDAVLVPSAVWDEVVVQGDGLPGAKEMRSARQDGWMAVVDIGDPDAVDRAGGALDPGEAEAIALALQEEEDARGRPRTPGRPGARRGGGAARGPGPGTSHHGNRRAPLGRVSGRPRGRSGTGAGGPPSDRVLDRRPPRA